MDQKTFSEILKEQLNSRGVSIERLSHLTAIPDRYLNALLEGNFQKLPAAPYVHGYLTKIAPLLDLDPGTLWESYKSGQEMKTSGPEDKLPSNRFAIKPVSKKILLGTIVGILVVVYVVWNVGHLLGRPTLEIVQPVAQTIIVAKPTIKLLGYINPSDKLFVNGAEVISRSDGAFEIEYSLEPGLNSIEFLAKRFLGRETEAVKQVIYQPAENE